MNSKLAASAPDTRRSIAERVSRNSMAILASDLLVRVASFFFLLFVARKLGVHDFGIYSVAVNLAIMLAVFYDGGIKSLIIREVARHRDETRRYYHNLLSLKVILAPVGLGGILFAGWAFGYSSSFLLLLSLIATQYYFASVDEFHSAFFTAHEVRSFEAILKIVQKVCYVAAGAVGLIFFHDISPFILATALSSIVSAVLGFGLMKRYFVPPRLAWQSSFVWSQLREAWPFALSSVAIGFYFYVDSILLSRIAGLESAGYYTAAYRLLEASLVIPFAFTGSINPILARTALESPGKMKRIVEFSLKALSCTGLPIAVACTILARPIITLLYGESYEQSAPALQILAWGILVIFLNTVLSAALNSLNRQRLWLLFLTAGALTNILCNVMFIPRYGILAASAITVLTELLVLLLMSSALVRFIGPFGILLDKRLLACNLLLGSFLYLAQEVHVGLTLLGAMIIYLMLILIFRVWTLEELDLLVSIVPPRYQPGVRTILTLGRNK